MLGLDYLEQPPGNLLGMAPFETELVVTAEDRQTFLAGLAVHVEQAWHVWLGLLTSIVSIMLTRPLVATQYSEMIFEAVVADLEVNCVLQRGLQYWFLTGLVWCTLLFETRLSRQLATFLELLRVTCLGADPLVSLSCLAVGFFRSAGASMFTLFHVGARRMPLVVRGRDASENVEALNH